MEHNPQPADKAHQRRLKGLRAQVMGKPAEVLSEKQNAARQEATS